MEDLTGNNKDPRHVFSFDFICLVIEGYPKEIIICEEREKYQTLATAPKWKSLNL